MKVLVFNIAKPKEAAAIFAYGVAYGLKKNGVEVYAFMQENVQNRKDWDVLLDQKHIYYTSLNNDKESRAKQLFRFFLNEKKQIRKHFDGVVFDAVITTVFANWAIFFRNCFKTKARIVVCHDPFPHSGEKKINKLLAKLYYQKCDKLIVLTKRFVEPASKLYKKRRNDVIAIPHGRMNLYQEIMNIEKKQPYKPENINFVFFGRIEKYKGLKVLEEAYKKLSQEYDNITLTVAGNGDFSEFKELYDTLPNATLLIRYIEDDEVGGLFDGPNVVTVVPYIDATQSGIISVAMEYGTPIIASDTGGLREQLNDGKIGVFFETGNCVELKCAMERFVHEPALFQEQCDLERKYLHSLNWDVVMAKFLECL